MIESMCVVCHGPVPRRGQRTGTTCNTNCRSHLREMRENDTDEPSDRYIFIRWHHHDRRMMLALIAKLEATPGVQAHRELRKANNISQRKRYHTKIKADPEALTAHRTQAREAMRKLRQERKARGLTIYGTPRKRNRRTDATGTATQA